MILNSFIQRSSYLFLLLLLSVGVSYIAYQSHLPAPNTPFLAMANTKIEKFTTEPWNLYIRNIPTFSKLPKSIIQQAQSKVQKGQWPNKSILLKLAINTYRSQLEKLLRAFPSRGCYPEGYLNSLSHQKPFTNLFNLWILRSVWNLQATQKEKTIKGLLRLDTKIQQLLLRCPIHRKESAYWMAIQQKLHQSYIFALVQKPLFSKYGKALFGSLNRWEQPPTFLQQVLQRDLKYVHRQLKTLLRHRWGGWWLRFWNAPKSTNKLSLQWLYTMTQLASKTKLLEKDWKTTAIEKYFEKILKDSEYLSFFRFNAVGLRSIANTLSQRRFRPLLMHWHKRRCIIAAHRSRWLQYFKGRAYVLPKEATQYPTKNPFSQKKFDPKRNTVCRIPLGFSWGLAIQDTLGVSVEKIPSPPKKQPPPPPTQALPPHPTKPRKRSRKRRKRRRRRRRRRRR